ncbi:hypothetical protein [Streptomyces dubilierae]|uniref:Minor tail protein n=1 Tax=Streptomyces dubilierae TaxID=3075533 RepID=A0ABU2P6N1_9ACTN|nr:hypothetical protein [Streptomyces sp. DSM 41921]MDT0387807.1 hypothetical protein [Streptomyces sp. DSM 41921]
MVFTPIAFGRRRWDVPLNSALQDLQDQVTGKLNRSGGALTGEITTNLTSRSAFFKTTSPLAHAVTIYQASLTGVDVAAALNVISDNRETSAVYVSGHETLPRGTVKISHTNGGTGATDDAGASALSIDLKRGTASGTAAQGLFMTSTDGGTTGRFVTIRNGGPNLFTVPAAGSVYTATGAFGEQLPVNHGFSGWTYDPVIATTGSLLTNGTLYLSKVHIPDDVTVTKVYWWVTTAGATPTTNQNFVGLYAADGTRLATTDVGSAITTTGLKSTTITGQALAAGSFVWVAMLFNAGTAPTVARATGSGGLATAVNANLTAGVYRFATNGTLQTSLPATITPGNNVAAGFAGPWAAVGP